MKLDLFLYKSPWDERGEESSSRRKDIFSPNFNFNFNFSKYNIFLIIFLLILAWFLSGIYSVKEGSKSVVLRFGQFQRIDYPGLNYHLPFPIETQISFKVDQSRRVEIGYVSYGSNGYSNTRLSDNASRDVLNESIMLTGDENIVELNADIMWHVVDLESFLFNVNQPQVTIKAVSESAIRDVIGNSEISSILSNQKQEITNKIEALIQSTLDQYKMGVTIEQVQLLKAEPPQAVIQAYRDVQTSKADKERDVNYAHSYRNDVVPKARGDAARIKQEALSYKAKEIARAKGEVERFNALLQAHISDKYVTRKRLYLSTLGEVFRRANLFIVDSNQLLPHVDILQNSKLKVKKNELEPQIEQK